MISCPLKEFLIVQKDAWCINIYLMIALLVPKFKNVVQCAHNILDKFLRHKASVPLVPAHLDFIPYFSLSFYEHNSEVQE